MKRPAAEVRIAWPVWGAVLLLLLLDLGLGAGCAAVSGSQTQDFGGIIKDRTAFNTTGPGQDVPDRYLDAGTRVRIIGGGGTYGTIQVQTVDGQTGFVSADEVEEAPGNNPSGRP
jgi:hypothetical protein